MKPDLEALALAYGVGLDDFEPWDSPAPAAAAPKKAKPWYPALNPTQEEIFNDPADNVLGHGEKGTGKSVGFGHKIVRHAYENEDALVLIITRSLRTGNDGIWYDLESLILPAWKEGNRDNRGELIDSGMELEYTQSKLDPLTKDRHRWIRNRFGGWSKLLLMSIQHAAQVQDRVKGPAPSMVYVDELTNCEGREYYTYTSAQLGRRRKITGPQQFTASCNPEGPSHWVYKLFWEECTEKTDVDGKPVLDEKDEPVKWTVKNGGKMGKDGVVRDKDFSVYHVPFSENKKWLPPGYVARVAKSVKGDPIEYQRLIEGKWVDRPTGEGLFKMYFNAGIHIKGDASRGIGLMPMPGFPLVWSYDLGQVYSSATLLQLVPTKVKTLWLVLDEVDHLDERILYKTMAWEIIERMRYWRTVPLASNGGKPYPFEYLHISDESALNQWRPGGEGSYDAMDFEKEFNATLESISSKVDASGQLKKMEILGCPKGPGSVAARVRKVSGKLFQEELFISALCHNTKAMLMNLEPDPKEPENPKRSKWIHKFDSLTYGIFKLEMAGIKNLPTEQRAPTLLRCGSSP